jgi:hypothetical protein
MVSTIASRPQIDWKDILTPNENILSSLTEKKKLIEPIQDRPIKAIFSEVKMKDRQALDIAVLECLELDPKTYLKPLYDGLTELIRERLNLAKSRKKVKQVKTQRDTENLKEQVLKEIVPDAPKRFPQEFIDSKYLKDSREIPFPKELLKLGDHFIGFQEVIGESGFRFDAANLEEAKFIIYSHAPDNYLIKIPNNKQTLTKAVRDYERYLKNLKDKLFEAFFNRTHDHKLSDALTQQAFEECGLPEV